MATPSKGIRRPSRPILTTEAPLMLRLAKQGLTIREIVEATGRSRCFVSKICRGVAPSGRRGHRKMDVLAIYEASRKPAGVLAHDLGYANARSLQSTISQAKRQRVQASEAQRPCL